MEPPSDSTDTLERREESARHVLHAFRERRRRRRGEDTYFGSAECFVDPGELAPENPERERRRSEVMADALTAGRRARTASTARSVCAEASTVASARATSGA